MSKEMIGYKFLTKDLKGPYTDFQYEIGKKYEIDGVPIMCIEGYHYCDNLIDIIKSSSPNCRICKVKAYGDICSNYNKTTFVTNKIEILEEVNISKEDRIIYAYAIIYNLSDEEIGELLSKPFDLNKYINDESTYVRITVAEQGYGLDKLINDENWQVRKAVAEQGYGLSKLIDDKTKDVKLAALNYILNDEKYRDKFLNSIKELYSK